MNFCQFWGSPVEISKIFFVTHARVPAMRAHSQRPNGLVSSALTIKKNVEFKTKEKKEKHSRNEDTD